MVHLKGGLTRSCKPGDAVSIAGVFLPEPYVGFRAMRAGLLTSTYLDAMGVTQLKQSYQQHAMDKELQDRMYVSPPRIKTQPQQDRPCVVLQLLKDFRGAICASEGGGGRYVLMKLR